MRKALALLALAGTSSLSAAQGVQISTVVETLIGTEVIVSGLIGYDDGSTSDYNFAIRSGERWYRVVMDAGRSAREQVQANCETDLDFIWGYDEFCDIEARGILNLDGSKITISVDDILTLTPPSSN